MQLIRPATIAALLLVASGCNLFRGSTPTNNDAPATNNANNANNVIANNVQNDAGANNAALDMGDPGDMGGVDDTNPPPDAAVDLPEYDGGPLPDLAWDPGVGRVTDNLLLHYTFEEGTGTEVLDRSTRGGAPSLQLGPTATWVAGRNGVHVTGPERITGPMVGSEIWDWVVPREELTVEVWTKPDNLTQDGPARLVTFSRDGSVRNFTIGQEDATWIVRFSVNDREFDSNGSPELWATGAATLTETQLVLTFDGLEARLYVNGVEAEADMRTGGLQHWDRQMPFQLGNENATGRPWAGEIYMLNVYDRALTPNEVQRNFTAGSAP